MEAGELGKTYQDGEIIVRQGEPGDRMYVIQAGRVAVTRRVHNRDVHIAELGTQDVFGEMALFERDSRSATVRAIGQVRVMSVDKKAFLRRVHEDPSLAYRILQQMSRRIRAIDADVATLKEQAEGEKSTLPPPASAHRSSPGGGGFLKYFRAGWRPPWKRAKPSSATSGATVHSTRPHVDTERRSSDRRKDDRRKNQRRTRDRRGPGRT